MEADILLHNALVLTLEPGAAPMPGGYVAVQGGTVVKPLTGAAEDGPSDAAVLHPVGTLRVSQKCVPLDLTISKIGSQKVTLLMDTRADMVVTSCPGCMLQLADGLYRTGSTASVAHLAEILAISYSMTPRQLRTADTDRETRN